MSILIDGLDDYLGNLIPKRDQVLEEMESYAKKHGFPIIGPQVGQLLKQYAQILDAKRIIELGSGYGYSAIWFAQATSPDAKIFCSDGSKTNAELARSHFDKAGVDAKIEFRVGDALEIMDSLDGEFDIVFCDIDKEGYPDAFNASIPRLRKGGLMLTDNTLWSGKVLESPGKTAATKGIQEFNRLAFSDTRVHSMIIPVRDGLCVTRKL
ncbi:MAG: O-methyltransferase [Candidatus Kariarchaeaceae archaeon]|jgi:predicted O-methyltransferase YrrM